MNRKVVKEYADALVQHLRITEYMTSRKAPQELFSGKPDISIVGHVGLPPNISDEMRAYFTQEAKSMIDISLTDIDSGFKE